MAPVWGRGRTRRRGRWPPRPSRRADCPGSEPQLAGAWRGHPGAGSAVGGAGARRGRPPAAAPAPPASWGRPCSQTSPARARRPPLAAGGRGEGTRGRRRGRPLPRPRSPASPRGRCGQVERQAWTTWTRPAGDSSTPALRCGWRSACGQRRPRGRGRPQRRRARTPTSRAGGGRRAAARGASCRFPSASPERAVPAAPCTPPSTFISPVEDGSPPRPPPRPAAPRRLSRCRPGRPPRRARAPR